MIRREDAQLEFGEGGGIGRVGGRQFQIGGVLDGQNVFVGTGGGCFWIAVVAGNVDLLLRLQARAAQRPRIAA